jgi:hypothetical protein
VNLEAHSSLFDHLPYGALPMRKLGAGCLELNEDNGIFRELHPVDRGAHKPEVVRIVGVRFQKGHELLGQPAVADRLRAFLTVELREGFGLRGEFPIRVTQEQEKYDTDGNQNEYYRSFKLHAFTPQQDSAAL